MVVEFARGTHRNSHEANWLSAGSPATALSQVCADRDRCPPHLGGKTVDFLSRKAAAKVVELECQFVRLLPIFEFSVIPHEPHQVPITKYPSRSQKLCTKFFPASCLIRLFS